MVGGNSLVLRVFFVWLLVFGPVFSAQANDPVDQSGDRNIRLRNRAPGLYLTPRPSAENPEAHNFSTSLQPVAPLSLEQMQTFLEENPDLKDHRLVIIGPAVSGDQAPQFKSGLETLLEKAGIEADVQIIRHPSSLREHLTNLWPRREDYEKPLVSELKVAAFKVLLAESLSFTVLLAPPLLLATGTEVTPTIDALVEQIALPTGVAVAMCVMDVANMIPLVSYRRALSNHNIRLTPLERFARQFVLSMFFSMNFYLLSQSPQIWDALTQTPWLELPAVTGAAAMKMGSVIVPASVFNMLSRTTTGTALNVWEQKGENRRFLTSIMEAVTGLLIAPLYILSTMPVLDPLVELPIAQLNPAHLGLLGLGTAGGAAWVFLERHPLSRWAKQTSLSCARKLKSLGEFLIMK